MPRGADDEQALTEDIIELAKQYGRYGYRRVTALLRSAGWMVNRKRVERIWSSVNNGFCSHEASRRVAATSPRR